MAKSVEKEDIRNDDFLDTFFKSNGVIGDKKITQKGTCCDRKIHNEVILVERVGPPSPNPIMPKHSKMINGHANERLSLDPLWKI